MSVFTQINASVNLIKFSSRLTVKVINVIMNDFIIICHYFSGNSCYNICFIDPCASFSDVSAWKICLIGYLVSKGQNL